jgi:hypothetical protein
MFSEFEYYSTETLMNSILQNAGVIVTVACSAAERGTVAADAAAVGDMVSSGGFGE